MSGLIRSDEELHRLRNIYNPSTDRGGYRIYKGFTLPGNFAAIQENIEEFEVFDDDIWIITFPKSGTTWIEEMVWCICNNVDLETAKRVNISIRLPFLEMQGKTSLCPDANLVKTNPELFDSVNFVKNCKRPRIIKTHLPWQLLPRQIRNRQKNPKMIILFRNPKDVCVSYYHHTKLFESYSGDFELFWQLFITGKVNWSPYFDNVLGYWKNCDSPNFFFLKYEDMKEDLCKVVKTTADFLNVHLPQPQISLLQHHLSFDEMRNNKAVNCENIVKIRQEKGLSSDPNGKFMRSGTVGSHKVEMSEEVIKVFDQWIEENLANTGLKL